MYVRDCTPVTPYALMLFGGDLTAEGGKLVPGAVKGKGRYRQQQMVMTESVLCVDGWIKFSVPYSIQTLLLAVRESLDALLKVTLNSLAILSISHAPPPFFQSLVVSCTMKVLRVGILLLNRLNRARSRTRMWTLVATRM